MKLLTKSCRIGICVERNLCSFVWGKNSFRFFKVAVTEGQFRVDITGVQFREDFTGGVQFREDLLILGRTF